MDRNERRRALQALDHAMFELLAHELAVAEHGGEAFEFRKLRPPDGGADSLAFCREGSAPEVFQAKHSPDRAPDWTDWETSLDAAVEYWTPSRVTFVFSNNFTAGHQTTFDRRLAGRHAGVKVEALTLADIERLLDEHPQIGPRFLGPTAVDLRRAVERATKLGGAQLETFTDLTARAGELADFADEQDPRFEYEHTLGRRTPRWEKVPYMTVVEETTGRNWVGTHAFEREEADVPPPIVSFTEDEPGRLARERAREELARGNDAVLQSGVRLLFPDAPHLVREMADDEYTMVRGVLSSPRSVEVRVRIEADEDTLERSFTMRSIPPKEGGGFSLAAVDGGLWFEIAFPDPPSAAFTLYCSARFGANASDNLLAASWARALTGDAQVQLSCPELFPDGLADSICARDDQARAELAARCAVYSKVVFIERSLEVELPTPERPTEQDLAVIQTVCDILRTGGGEGTFHRGKMLVSREDIGRFRGTIRGARRRDRILFELWGLRLALGEGEWALPPLVVVGSRPASDSEVELELRPEGDSRMTFELVGRGRQADEEIEAA